MERQKSLKNKIIEVQNISVSILKEELDDYICITDIAKAKSGELRSADVIKNWLRNRNTLEFLGTWELIYNPDFKVVEFDLFKCGKKMEKRYLKSSYPSWVRGLKLLICIRNLCRILSYSSWYMSEVLLLISSGLLLMSLSSWLHCL